MPRKKKNKQKDARGYATTNSTPKPASAGKARTHTGNKNQSGGKVVTPVVGHSNTRIEMSAKGQLTLMQLLDDLKSKLSSTRDNTRTFGPKRMNNETDGGTVLIVSEENKQFVKKITSMNDQLKDVGFNREQIVTILQALIHGQSTINSTDFSIDAALDWSCVNMPSKELPTILTEVNLVEEVKSSDGKMASVGGIEVDKTFSHLSVGTTREMKDTVEEKTIDDESWVSRHAFITQSQSDQNRKNDNSEKKLENEVNSTSNTRAWLLEQYQYEDDSEGEGSACGNKPVHEETMEQVKSPLEHRLEKLEDEIRELKESLQDEAANYMRSKYEIADMKKNLRKMENSAKGLRGRVAKEKAAATATLLVPESCDSVQTKHMEKDRTCLDSSGKDAIPKEPPTIAPSSPGKDEDDEGGLFDMFEMGDESAAVNVSSDNVTKVDQPIVMISDKPSIPSGWTGKTPKDYLLEHCRKQDKNTKPIFHKRPMNGCKVTIKLSSMKAVIEEESGPCFSYADAQHFASTRALYKLTPTLPLYRVFPPVFRDLWKSWIDEKDEEIRNVLQAKDEQKKEEVLDLIKSIKAARNDSTEKVADGKGNMSGLQTAISPSEHEWDEDGTDSDIEENDVRQSVTSHEGEKLRDAFLKKTMDSGYLKMRKIRESLPIHQYRDEIITSVKNNPVTVLCAETGAGKTTQCPQFLLEEALASGMGDNVSIICTQPRRVSAVSVAERVCDEMVERVGDQVGYHIRMESKKSRKTKLLFCTTGVILRRLQDDSNLEGVSHILVDEVHERQWQIDFLLITLRRLLRTTRKDLKVILMSATVDSQLFCNFFEGAPFLSVPGRTFKVNEYFLEDILEATGHVIEEGSRCALRTSYSNNQTSLWVTGRGGEKRRQVVSLESEVTSDVSDDYIGYTMATRRSMDRVDEQAINYDLIEDLLTLLLVDKVKNTSIVPPTSSESSHCFLSTGSVLIFLPGMGEIRSLNDRLKSSRLFGDSSRFSIIPMHSSISPTDQRKAFMKPRHGCQKIILGTNILETSVTIADCVCVIDTGLVKEVEQDKKYATSSLRTKWCSKASSKQRSGRAGRVQPGVCCKLYSSRTAQQVMKAQSMPELQRIPLEEVCLSILASNLASNCMDFLLQAPQPPCEETVRASIDVLEEVGAIDTTSSTHSGEKIRVESLTPLGYHLAKFPIHVRLSKMLIYGSLFKALDRSLTIAASLSVKSPFSTNIDNAQQATAAHKSFAHSSSDFFTVCNVFDAYVEALKSGGHSNAKRFCEKNYLNKASLMEIYDLRIQFLQLLTQIGFVKKGMVSQSDDLAASCYNVHGRKDEVLNVVICAGLYPNIAHAVKSSIGQISLWHREQSLHFHSSSVNSNVKRLPSADWVVFHEKFVTSKTFVSGTSFVKPFSLLLSGDHIQVRHRERSVVVDDWMVLKVAAQTATIFREVRYEIARTLSRMIEDVGTSTYTDGHDAFLDGVVKLLSCEEY